MAGFGGSELWLPSGPDPIAPGKLLGGLSGVVRQLLPPSGLQTPSLKRMVAQKVQGAEDLHVIRHEVDHVSSFSPVD